MSGGEDPPFKILFPRDILYSPLNISVKTFHQDLDEAIKLPLYHGTASYNTASIKTHGLEAWDDDPNDDDPEYDKFAHLTTNPAIALREACYTVYGDPHGKEASYGDWNGHGDPPKYLAKAKPVVIKVDRTRVKGLKHDPEYLEGSTTRAYAFKTNQPIPAEAILEVIQPKTAKGKARIQEVFREFQQATNSQDTGTLDAALKLLDGWK